MIRVLALCVTTPLFPHCEFFMVSCFHACHTVACIHADSQAGEGSSTSWGVFAPVTQTLRVSLTVSPPVLARNALVVSFAALVAYSFQVTGYQPFVLTGKTPEGLPDAHIPPFSVTTANGTISFTEMVQVGRDREPGQLGWGRSGPWAWVYLVMHPLSDGQLWTQLGLLSSGRGVSSAGTGRNEFQIRHNLKGHHIYFSTLSPGVFLPSWTLAEQEFVVFCCVSCSLQCELTALQLKYVCFCQT